MFTYARVASFNLGDGADQMVDQFRSDVESGNRPPGLEEAKGWPRRGLCRPPAPKETPAVDCGYVPDELALS